MLYSLDHRFRPQDFLLHQQCVTKKIWLGSLLVGLRSMLSLLWPSWLVALTVFFIGQVYYRMPYIVPLMLFFA